MATTLTNRTVIERRPEYSQILREHREFASGQSNQMSHRINGWFDRLILQSGMQMAPEAFLMLCVFSAVTLGGIILLITDEIVSTLLAASLGIGAPILIAAAVRSHRQRKMTAQLPSMIEQLARATRTGRSLEHCFQHVANATPAPLGDELKLSARKSEMGLDLASALKDLPNQTGLASVTTFVTALSVHQETGGDLIKVLERLARVIRDRTLVAGRLNAATMTGKLTAGLMLIVPPFTLTSILFQHPQSFSRLMSSPWGQTLVWATVIWQTIGLCLVLWSLRRSFRA